MQSSRLLLGGSSASKRLVDIRALFRDKLTRVNAYSIHELITLVLTFCASFTAGTLIIRFLAW